MTRGLWWPAGDFPVIPWLNLRAPASLDHALAWGTISAWFGVIVATCAGAFRLVRACSVVGIACLGGSILLDQQRLQVWAWEFLWLQLFFTLATPRVAVVSSRLLVVGIYFYSAISKLDAGFVQNQGPWLWQGLCRAMGREAQAWGNGGSAFFLAFPLGEFAVAATLVLRRWRRLGILLSIGMHLTLLLALGPWGWQQRPGVLLWNLFFLMSVPLLFWRTEQSAADDRTNPETPRAWGDEFSLLAAIALGIWPALEGASWCDHWPAWAVYSSRPEIVRIDIPESQVSQLPAELRKHVGPAEALSEWRPISIDQWSFEARGCPIYPQSRYRLAVARALKVQCGVTLRVTEQSSPHRWTGKRQFRAIPDLGKDCDDRFLFSTFARTIEAASIPSSGQRLIAITAQFAVASYLLMLWVAARRGNLRASRAEAIIETIGLVSLAAHVVAAFHYLHHWDHAAALQHTAQRTAEVTGWHWSGGLYVNYLFLALWVADVVRAWLEALQLRNPRGNLWRLTVRCVFLFMMFNATVVFGPAHWIVVAAAYAVFYLILRSVPARPLSSTEPAFFPNQKSA